MKNGFHGEHGRDFSWFYRFLRYSYSSNGLKRSWSWRIATSRLVGWDPGCLCLDVAVATPSNQPMPIADGCGFDDQWDEPMRRVIDRSWGHRQKRSQRGSGSSLFHRADDKNDKKTTKKKRTKIYEKQTRLELRKPKRNETNKREDNVNGNDWRWDAMARTMHRLLLLLLSIFFLIVDRVVLGYFFFETNPASPVARQKEADLGNSWGISFPFFLFHLHAALHDASLRRPTLWCSLSSKNLHVRQLLINSTLTRCTRCRVMKDSVCVVAKVSGRRFSVFRFQLG